jgi:hypothetical protein
MFIDWLIMLMGWDLCLRWYVSVESYDDDDDDDAAG